MELPSWPIEFSWIFVRVGGSLMKEMEQGWFQWSYGFLEGAWEVGIVIGWSITLEEVKEKIKVFILVGCWFRWNRWIVGLGGIRLCLTFWVWDVLKVHSVFSFLFYYTNSGAKVTHVCLLWHHVKERGPIFLLLSEEMNLVHTCSLVAKVWIKVRIA